MLILPAIDLRKGNVVRLLQGRAENETIYGADPAAQAAVWQSKGAKFLHLVDLDGAFDGEGGNVEAIRSIVRSVKIPCEVGGGIRDLGAASKLLSLGVHRVIFGTAAVNDPDEVGRAVTRFGAERIVVGIDARDGFVAVKGWTETSTIPALKLALSMREKGVRRIVYTDISRDGMSTGPNVEATVKLARESGLKVIASGGVGSLDHVRALVAHEADGIEGIIVGKALYDGRVTLEDVLKAAGKSATA